MLESMLVLASLGTAPSDRLRLPDPVDGPRLSCALIIDPDVAAVSCIELPVSPLAPLRSMRPQPRPETEVLDK